MELPNVLDIGLINAFIVSGRTSEVFAKIARILSEIPGNFTQIRASATRSRLLLLLLHDEVLDRLIYECLLHALLIRLYLYFLSERQQSETRKDCNR